MSIRLRVISAAAGVLSLGAQCAAADPLKIASPQPGSWESAIPVLGQQQGFFRKQGLELEIVSTSGSGETLQAVISGAVDVGLSAGTVGVLGPAANLGNPLAAHAELARAAARTGSPSARKPDVLRPARISDSPSCAGLCAPAASHAANRR